MFLLFITFSGTIKVISAKLSKSGSPLVVLATRHAFLFDTSLMCWLRVADDCFPASNFASSWNFGSVQSGELATLQVDVRKYLARKPGWSRVTDDGVQTRAHLESQLASSLALRSPNEYRQCLLSYIRFLAREADESRLREVCESFLGPPTGMVEATSADLKNPAWEPCVLGMRKHKLLREDILPAMATNRKVQRLLNEFMDLLSEYESTEINIDEKDPAPPTRSALATEKTDSAPPATDQMDSAPLATDQMDSVPTATDPMDSTPPATDQMDTAIPATEQMDTATPATDQMDSAPSATDQMDSTSTATDQMNPAPEANDQMDPVPPATDQMDSAFPTTDQKDSTTLATDGKESASLASDKVNSVLPMTEQVNPEPVPDQGNLAAAAQESGS
ncbi:hypothetical protein Pint_31917 [Pistacia integerrima]|uniref:Uncharacterized protein n=1 Tax=Pistacia integerrima TaxID=434235 RepID=A0ACC0XMM5_9ROSI|nr:hypothetical protein Pint_31917 [Pistacia integerrima]